MTPTQFRIAWRRMWHQKADWLRTGWAVSVAEWEAETEPGYPLPPLTAASRKLDLAVADLYDALGGRR